MTTTRNNLPAKLMPHDTLMLDEIDAAYEILSAELPSHKDVYDYAMRLVRQYDNPKSRLADFFLGKVRGISKRDGLMLGVPEENFKSVADQLAADWDSVYGVDYRREKAGGSAPYP